MSATASVPRPQASLWRDALRRLGGHRGARVGFGLVAGLILLALLADVVRQSDPNGVYYEELFIRPLQGGHLMGTDDLGRDVFDQPDREPVLSGPTPRTEYPAFTRERDAPTVAGYGVALLRAAV